MAGGKHTHWGCEKGEMLLRYGSWCVCVCVYVCITKHKRKTNTHTHLQKETHTYTHNCAYRHTLKSILWVENQCVCFFSGPVDMTVQRERAFSIVLITEGLCVCVCVWRFSWNAQLKKSIFSIYVIESCFQDWSSALEQGFVPCVKKKRNWNRKAQVTFE